MSVPIIEQLLAENCPAKKGVKKFIFWGFRIGKFVVLKLRPPPLGNQSPPEHVIWRKNGGDTPKNVCSSAAQEISKNKK